VGGFFTGHQLNGTHGLICLQSDVAHWFHATLTDLQHSGEGFADINNVPWAKAARAATTYALARGSQAGSSQVTNLMENTASFAYRKSW
jgi:hypothetical protein